MPKGRLGAFSDGVITIMVLELHTPVGISWHTLGHELPVLFAYALSSVYFGIHWNNHHHMLAAVPGDTPARSRATDSVRA